MLRSISSVCLGFLALAAAITILAASPGCGGGGGAGPLIKVTITAPANGAAVCRGPQVAITATLAVPQSVTIDRVEFAVDGTAPFGVDLAAPYAAILSTVDLAAGAHTVTATAHDDTGRSGSGEIQIQVDVCALAGPQVQIGAPAAFTRVDGQLEVEASATPGEPGSVVQQIDVTVGGLSETIAGSAGTASFSTALLADGPHEVSAVATDSYAQTGQQTLEIMVGNAVAAGPAIAFDVDPAAPGVQYRASRLAGVPFEVAIVALNVADLTGFNAAGPLDPGLLSVGGATEGPFLSSAGGQTSFASLLQAASFEIADAILGGFAGVHPDGSGVLARLSLTAVAAGEASLIFAADVGAGTLFGQPAAPTAYSPEMLNAVIAIQ